jgi:hypothetical protein
MVKGVLSRNQTVNILHRTPGINTLGFLFYTKGKKEVDGKNRL